MEVSRLTTHWVVGEEGRFKKVREVGSGEPARLPPTAREKYVYSVRVGQLSR